MAATRGADVNFIVKQGSTHGTAIQGTTGDKMIINSLTHNTNTKSIPINGIGAGLSARSQIIKTADAPSLSFSGFAGYDNNFGHCLGMFMGTSGAPSEQNVGEGDYLHTTTYTSDAGKFATIAWDPDSADEIEYPSCYPTRVQLSTDIPGGLLSYTFDWVADVRDITSPTNTTASLASATVTDAERFIVHTQSDEFLINTSSGGALASPTDRISITSFTLTLEDPKEVVAEFKGASGNSAPRLSGLFLYTLTVTMKDQDTLNAWQAAQDAETEYKASFTIDSGEQIASGDNYNWYCELPRLKIISDPDSNLKTPGMNPLSVTFEGLVASSAPTGMSSTLPAFFLTNTDSAAMVT